MESCQIQADKENIAVEHSSSEKQTPVQSTKEQAVETKPKNDSLKQ